MKIASSPYNFPFVLLAVLLVMALASFVWTRPRFLGSETAPALMLSICAAGGLLAPLLAAVAMNVGIVPSTTSILRTIVYYLVVTGPSIFGIAGIFPYYCSRAEGGASSNPRTVARLYFTSAIGTIVVAALTLGVLIPTVGREVTFAGACVVCALAALTVLPKSRRRLAVSIPIAVIAIGATALPLLPQSSLFFAGLSANNIVEIREGVSGRAAITADGHVVVNGQNMGAYPVEERTLRQMAPSLLADPAPASVLVLGLGSGSIFRQLEQAPSVQAITIVDWSREVSDLLVPSSTLIPTVVANLDASRVVKVLPKQNFDMVFDNLSFTTWVGSTGVKTPGFFGDVSRVITANGIYAFATNYRWHHRDMVLRGALRAFSHVVEYPHQDIVLATNNADFDPAALCQEREPARNGAGEAALIERNAFDCSDYFVASSSLLGDFGVFTDLDFRQEYIYTPKDFILYLFGWT